MKHHLRRLAGELRRQAIGVVALFVALGGAAYAAATVRSVDIVDGTIQTVDIANNGVHYNNILNVPFLRQWDVRSDDHCDLGVDHDVRFKFRSGYWPGLATDGEGNSRIPVFREGKYSITATVQWQRKVYSGSVSSATARLKLVAFSTSGQRRVLATQTGFLDTRTVRAFQLNVAALEHLKPGEQVAVQIVQTDNGGSTGEAPCTSVDGAVGSPNVTIAWLGK